METVLIILVAAGGLIGIGVLGVFGLTLVDRLKKAPADSRMIRQRLDDLEQRLGETEEHLAQLSRSDEQILELDERLEFAERLLQQIRNRDRLPPRGDHRSSPWRTRSPTLCEYPRGWERWDR